MAVVGAGDDDRVELGGVEHRDRVVEAALDAPPVGERRRRRRIAAADGDHRPRARAPPAAAAYIASAHQLVPIRPTRTTIDGSAPADGAFDVPRELDPRPTRLEPDRVEVGEVVEELVRVGGREPQPRADAHGATGEDVHRVGAQRLGVGRAGVDRARQVVAHHQHHVVGGDLAGCSRCCAGRRPGSGSRGRCRSRTPTGSGCCPS